MHSAERQLESCSRTCRGGSKQSEYSDIGWCPARQKGCSEEARPLPVRGHCRSLRICYLVFAQWQQCYHDTFAAQNACANNPLSSFHHSWAPNAPVMHLVHLHRTFSQFTSWPSPKRSSLQLSWKCFSSVLCMCISQQNRSSTPCFQWWDPLVCPAQVPEQERPEVWGASMTQTWRMDMYSSKDGGAYLCELTGLRSQPPFMLFACALFVLWLH